MRLQPLRQLRGVALGEPLLRDERPEADAEGLAALVQELVEHGHVAQLRVPVGEPVEEPGVARLHVDRA